jgi:hypothetical protein
MELDYRQENHLSGILEVLRTASLVIRRVNEPYRIVALNNGEADVCRRHVLYMYMLPSSFIYVLP